MSKRCNDNLKVKYWTTWVAVNWGCMTDISSLRRQCHLRFSKSNSIGNLKSLWETFKGAPKLKTSGQNAFTSLHLHYRLTNTSTHSPSWFFSDFQGTFYKNKKNYKKKHLIVTNCFKISLYVNCFLCCAVHRSRCLVI